MIYHLHIYYMSVGVPECLHVYYMCARACRSQKRALHPFELGLHTVDNNACSCGLWELNLGPQLEHKSS